LKTGGDESMRLRSPALFVELASVGQHNRTISAAVMVGEDCFAVLSRERHGFLSERKGRREMVPIKVNSAD